MDLAVASGCSFRRDLHATAGGALYGRVTAGGCDPSAAVGTCETTYAPDSCIVDVYSPPFTAESARAFCSAPGVWKPR